MRFPALLAAVLVSTAAVAAPTADRPGAPPELVGSYGASPEQCRSYHRKDSGLTVIGAGTWTSGGAGLTAPEVAQIRSHRQQNGRLILSLSGPASRLTVQVLDEGTLEIERPKGSGPSTTLVRCGGKDVVAGIGLDTIPAGQTKAMNAVFTASYAKAVPSICPQLTAADAVADQVVWLGRQAWKKFLVERKLASYGPTMYELEAQRVQSRTEARARDAAAADARAVGDFCERVLDAFGEQGRVIPRLLKDPRPRA